MRADAIRQVLPVAYQSAERDSALEDLLAVMAAMHAPVEVVLDDLDRYVDPRRCPDRFVAYLAGWVGLGWLVDQPLPTGGFPTGLGRLRELVARAGPLAERRGTAEGLRRFLGLLLGEADITVDQSADRPFVGVVTVPERARPHEELVRRAIDELKPASVQVELRFADPARPDEEG